LATTSSIAKLRDGSRVLYLDIGAEFLDGAGYIPSEVMSDGLRRQGLRDLGRGGDRPRRASEW
jgi:hypothetical protein